MGIVAGALALGCGSVFGGEPDPAVERGRVALTSTGYLKPAWSEEAYRDVAKLWEEPPSPDEPYEAAFNRRYGLHPAPFPNDGLPMGLRRGNGPGGVKTGLQIDCMVCHGGSIGGTSYVGLGNTTLDLKALFDDLTRADGKRLPPSLFNLNTTRGTVNAGTISAILIVGWKFETFSSASRAALTAPQARYYYDASRFGLGNGGHRFGDKLDDGERSDLIEYLKTL